ncbi:MAG: glycosyltransferase, partial [Candidatus Nanopusillus sp.]|nr:glycosyltransferase [Candidatus Nanopusillus sp.]
MFMVIVTYLKYYMIAIILVNFNSKSILYLINFILKQLINEKDIVIYFVDNGSTDNSNLILLNLLSNLAIYYRHFHLPYNLGFVRAVNFAFRKLDRGVKYVVLLNNDLVPVRGVIGRLVDVLESGGFAGVQGTIMQLLRPW